MLTVHTPGDVLLTVFTECAPILTSDTMNLHINGKDLNVDVLRRQRRQAKFRTCRFKFK